MLGFEDDELPCEFSSWKDRVHPDDLQRALDEINDHISKKTDFYYCEHRLKHKNGSWVWIMDKGRAFFDENGEPFRMVGTHTDMTYIKENEQKLKDMQDVLVAQSRYAAMGEMIGMIAHQWRQPLTALGMVANNVRMDVDFGVFDAVTLKTQLDSIDSQIQFLSQTVDDFRNFFKPKMIAEETDVDELIGGALKIIGGSFEGNNIVIQSDTKNACDIKFTINKSEMIQAILVILQNAKDALVENETKNAKIQIACSVNENENSIDICICDNAGGVPQELKYKIFEPYFSTKTIKNGTGLGLYIAKTIVEKHEGGSVWVENKDNGACFWIRLPLADSNQGMRE
jgi:PAS domain S-box-containing protein